MNYVTLHYITYINYKSYITVITIHNSAEVSNSLSL